jgi:hypothetical protein
MAGGYCVSTVGRDVTVIRECIRNQGQDEGAYCGGHARSLAGADRPPGRSRRSRTSRSPDRRGAAGDRKQRGTGLCGPGLHRLERAAEAAEQHGLRLEVVKHPMAKRGLVLLPRRWVVERSFAWAARFRRLARDYERLDTTLKGPHLLAFATLMLRNLVGTLK